MEPIYGLALEASVRNLVADELGLRRTLEPGGQRGLPAHELLRRKVDAYARQAARDEIASLIAHLLQELESDETAELRSCLARLLPLYGTTGETRPGP